MTQQSLGRDEGDPSPQHIDGLVINLVHVDLICFVFSYLLPLMFTMLTSTLSLQPPDSFVGIWRQEKVKVVLMLGGLPERLEHGQADDLQDAELPADVEVEAAFHLTLRSKHNDVLALQMLVDSLRHTRTHEAPGGEEEHHNLGPGVF